MMMEAFINKNSLFGKDDPSEDNKKKRKTNYDDLRAMREMMGNMDDIEFEEERLALE